MSQTYGSVDDSEDPGKAADWQREMAAWPAVAAYKRRTYELLSDAGFVLDVGCGPGVDVSAMGPSRAIGVDPSWTMCTTAAAGEATIVRGDAHDLPFASATFDGVRADRVVQHLRDPDHALREFTRTLRPGGRIVVADPDQESLVIQVPGVRASTLDRLKALRRDVGYRNGRLISGLPARLRQFGIERVTVDAFPLLIDDPGKAFGLPSWPSNWQARAGFTQEELEEWSHAIEQARGRGFVYLVTFLVVAGTKR